MIAGPSIGRKLGYLEHHGRKSLDTFFHLGEEYLETSAPFFRSDRMVTAPYLMSASSRIQICDLICQSDFTVEGLQLEEGTSCCRSFGGRSEDYIGHDL